MSAPGGPGLAPRWTGAAKEAVRTGRSPGSHLGFTITRGAVSEVYWPTIDRPQVRDLQSLVSDGATLLDFPDPAGAARAYLVHVPLD
jgi:glucoamylase